ncbi:hypothetical protein MJI20_30310, partial [Salmonella enterica subsp. enterica serovar Anatum]|nr:hypothetical protein [Salmonella enterica subsp. enterica serovar Anatum]
GAWAFLFSSLTLACIILTAGIAMFPFVMPSSTMMNASLTMWDLAKRAEKKKEKEKEKPRVKKRHRDTKNIGKRRKPSGTKMQEQ